MKLTFEILDEGKSVNGAWNRKQLKALGVKWPLKKGWQRRIVGRDVTEAAVNEFLLRRNEHLELNETDPFFIATRDL